MLIGEWLLGCIFTISATLVATAPGSCAANMFSRVFNLFFPPPVCSYQQLCVWLAERELLFMPNLLPCLPCTCQSYKKKSPTQQQPSFLQFNSIQLVTPACGWLPLIGGQYVFALRVSCGAKTSWWDCFCRRFPRVYRRPCVTTIMLVNRVTWLIASFLCHIPPHFRKVVKSSWNPAEKEIAQRANTFIQRPNMGPTETEEGAALT